MLYKRGKVWWVKIKKNYRVIRRSTETSSKERARKIEAQVLLELANNRLFNDEAKRRTFEELRDRYMQDHSKVNKAPDSVLRDECSFKRLSAFFGGLTLAQLTPARISEYKSRRRHEKAKTATLAKELEVLRHALNFAVREWEWLERNPFEKIKIDKPNNKVERWITFEEEKRLLDVSPIWLKEIITFALNTGMRRNEILSLQWSEVDLFRRTATLLKTKNKEKRTVPLNQTALELLKVKNKVRSISGFVFSGKACTKIIGRNLLRAFYSARETANLADVRFHDLRHTFATRLVQSGIDLYVVKELLGHKTITMTMRYAHHFPESLRHGVEVLDGWGAQKGAQSTKKGYGKDRNPLNSMVGDAGFEPATPAV
jgi:integrase